jgi:hypothetical protein
LPADPYLRTLAEFLVKDKTNFPHEIVIVKPKLPECFSDWWIDNELIDDGFKYDLLEVGNLNMISLDVLKKITERNTRPPGIHLVFITKLLKFPKIPSGGILNLFLETPDSIQKE